MDPITLGLAVAGAGLSIYGASEGRRTAQKISGLEQDKIAINTERMKLDALTSQRDLIRASMAQRANAVNAGANSGAGADSSGLAGALAQISGAQTLKSGSIDTALDFGIRTGKINSEISALGGEQQDNQMISSIGSSLFSNSRTIGKFFQ
jgi:hypothetical protein